MCFSEISKIYISLGHEYKYLLLAKCEVHTAIYRPKFFPSFYGPSAKRAGHENKEGKNRGP